MPVKQLEEGVNIGVLGRLLVEGRAGPVDLGPPRQQHVFAILALNANRPLPTQRVVDAVWGTAAPAYAANLVHKYVSGLRRAVELLPPNDRVTIDRTGRGYQLTTRADQIDIDVFHRLVHTARQLGRTDPGAATFLFRRALALWRGPLLPEMTGAVFEDEREFTEAQRLSVIEEYTSASIAVGCYPHAITVLQEAVRAHPLEENLVRLLILGLYRSGRTAEALRVYQRLRKRLIGELDVRPHPELHELYQAIRQHRPHPAFARDEELYEAARQHHPHPAFAQDDQAS